MNERIVKDKERIGRLILGFGLLLVLVLSLVLFGPRPLLSQGSPAVVTPPLTLALPASVAQPVPDQRADDTVVLKLPTPAANPTAGSNPALAAVPAVGRPAPDFSLKTLKGETVTLSELRGQPVLLNFWASWCPPCRREMPQLIRAYERHRVHDLVTLGINVTSQDTLADAQAFVDEFEVSYPTLLDESGAVTEELYQVRGLPTSFLIDREGRVARVKLGEMSGPLIEEWVTGALKY